MDEPAPQQPSSPEPPRSPQHSKSDSSLTASQNSPPDAVSRPPSLSSPGGSMAFSMSPSSAPLGPTTAARRPGPLPSRASGLNSDIQAKMKAFSLSRQGAPPPSAQNMRGGQAPGPGGFVGGPLTGAAPSSPNSSAANLRLPPGMNRPSAPSFGSSPSPVTGSPRMSPRPPVGGLAAKRGLKPGGMKLSDAQKPVPAGQEADKTDTGSQFNKFSNIIDTRKGTLNFQNKAVIHGSGIDFEGGSTFSISLDEVDTIAELGKGNYGTVFQVRHARPKLRRPGLGLRGNMLRSSSVSVSKEDNEPESSPQTSSST